MASDTQDKASNQKNYSVKNENALNENNDLSDSAPADGVDVPEEFQQAVHKLTHKATKSHLSHMRNKINEREVAITDEEMSKKGDKGNMSLDSAPSSVGD